MSAGEQQFKKLERELRPRITPPFFAYVILAIFTAAAFVDVAKHQYDIASSRARAGRSFCLQTNEQARRNRAGLIDQSRVLLDAAERGRASDPTRPAPNPEAIKAYVDDVKRSAALQHPLRDCSPAGLRDFTEHPPNPLVEICRPDGRGYCLP